MKKHLPAIYLSCFSAVLLFLFARAVHIHADGHVWATPQTVWGDWAVHFTMASSMAERALFLTFSPLLIFAPFHYPFLANLISALLLRAGVPFLSAFWVPSFLFTATGGILLYVLYRRLFQSRGIAALAHVMFFLNGGLGFVWLAKKAMASDQPWKILLNPPALVPLAEPYPLVWDSVLRGIFLPQRSFQLGFAVGMGALVLLFSAVTSRASGRTGKWAAAGVLMGLLPMSHLHTFAAVGIVAFVWMGMDLWAHRKSLFAHRFGLWLHFGVPAVSLAALQIWALPVADFGHSMSRWAPGWYINNSIWGWIKFWIVNWGATPALAAFGVGAFLTDSKRTGTDKRNAVGFLVPFGLLFAILNLFVLQPWIWDNTKMLAWVSVAVSGFAGYGVWALAKKSKTAAMAVFILAVLSGGIETARLVHPKAPENELYTKEEWDLADWTRRNTEPSGTWLASYHHNNWIYNLAGRQVMMAYDGWLWSHGYEYDGVKTDLETLLKDPARADLLTKYGIVFASVGPIERDRFGADLKKFDLAFDRIHETPNYILFRRRMGSSLDIRH